LGFGIDFEVKEGDFVALVGLSESGKSTLLHLLGGLDKPTEREVTLAGQPLAALSDKPATLARRHNVGLIFHFFICFPP
jgi:putative ABC transport system ATP-binding protein